MHDHMKVIIVLNYLDPSFNCYRDIGLKLKTNQTLSPLTTLYQLN
jgi:hypothetical protein